MFEWTANMVLSWDTYFTSNLLTKYYGTFANLKVILQKKMPCTLKSIIDATSINLENSDKPKSLIRWFTQCNKWTQCLAHNPLATPCGDKLWVNNGQDNGTKSPNQWWIWFVDIYPDEISRKCTIANNIKQIYFVNDFCPFADDLILVVPSRCIYIGPELGYNCACR